MQRNAETTLLWLIIAFGVLLRLLNIEAVDLEPDEAQAVLFATQAWPPLGMFILMAAQEMLGHTIAVVRGVSVLFGVVTLSLLYLIARELRFREEHAILVVALASIFPSHILFSKLAYPSIQQSFFWLLLLYSFLRFRRRPAPTLLVGIFIASVAATFVKPQGALFPCLLFLGALLEQRKLKTKNHVKWPVGHHVAFTGYQLVIVLLLSLLPITLTIATSPGIPATLLLYGGNMYGLSGFLGRLMLLGTTWWHLLTLFLVAVVLSIPYLRKLPWPVLVLLFLSVAVGLVLGPDHEYYATKLVLFVLPIGIAMMKLKPSLRSLSVCILTFSTLFTIGPRIAQEPGYWNMHAAKLNNLLEGEEAVTVLGHAGHHVRWYLRPELLVGRNMQKPYPTNVVLELKGKEQWDIKGGVLYEDDRVRLVHQ